LCDRAGGGVAGARAARAARPAPGGGGGGGGERGGGGPPGGGVSNTLAPPYPPQRTTHILKTPQTVPTIADRLDAAGITWAWYATGWGGGANAVKQGLTPHHNPFQYVKRIMETPEGRSHIRDASEFVRALRDGGLPSVSFVKPHWKDNAHAVSSTVGAGARWVGGMGREVIAAPSCPPLPSLTP